MLNPSNLIKTVGELDTAVFGFKDWFVNKYKVSADSQACIQKVDNMLNNPHHPELEECKEYMLNYLLKNGVDLRAR